MDDLVSFREDEDFAFPFLGLCFEILKRKGFVIAPEFEDAVT